MDLGSAVEKAVVPDFGATHGRRHYRQRIHSLAYVNVNEGNGGIIRDLSETGLAVQTVAALRTGEEVALKFDLFGPRVRMEATGRVAWATSSGQAGIEFTSIPLRLKRLLKEWLFIQILTTAHSTAWNSMFNEAGEFESRSSCDAAFDEIQEAAAEAVLKLSGEESKRKLWRLKPARMLAWFIDGSIVLGGVTLFWLIAMGITRIFPGWRTAATLTLVSGLVFGFLYRSLFVFATGETPGNYLAGTSTLTLGELDSEEGPRFR